jgi:hypothetical protein
MRAVQYEKGIRSFGPAPMLSEVMETSGPRCARTERTDSEGIFLRMRCTAYPGQNVTTLGGGKLPLYSKIFLEKPLQWISP